MAVTTFLHDGELNQPTSNKVLNELMAEVRQKTGRDWQIIELKYHPKKRWWQRAQKPVVIMYELYVYVGGFGPWQQINFYNDQTDWSINLRNTSSVVAAYLHGILAGVHSMELKNDKAV
jgi:hypothetical protein